MEKNIFADSFYADVFHSVAQSRGHYTKQAKVIDYLFQIAGIQKSSRVLDIACAAGSVLIELFNKGYNQLFGTDGSEALINKLTSCQKMAEINLQVCDWNDLESYLNRQGAFDSIIIMGQSLGCYEAEKIPKLLATIFDHLKNDGLFICDTRHWVTTTDGTSIEADRPTGLLRSLGYHCSQTDGQKYFIDEQVSYSNAYQQVDYFFTKPGQYHPSFKVTFDYFLLTHTDVAQYLKNAGFDESSIQVRKFLDYPYVVLTAHKRNHSHETR